MSAVDIAMAEDRPEKGCMRELWMETVVEVDAHYAGDGPPLYLTLPGARGFEIDLLIARGVLETTETGAIAPEHQQKVIAIESRREAIAALAARYPGLKLLRESVQNVLKTSTPLQWPAGEALDACRARVINLDLNTSFDCVVSDGHLDFPLVRLVDKLAIIQAAQTPRPSVWHLMLTLDSRIQWTRAESRLIKEYLRANFDSEPAFAASARDALGDDLYEEILRDRGMMAAGLESAAQQALLMTLVPKALARVCANAGWRLETLRNLRYGDGAQRAAMVSWLFRANWDQQLSRNPEQGYRASLRTVHAHVGHIEANGRLVEGH